MEMNKSSLSRFPAMHSSLFSRYGSTPSLISFNKAQSIWMTPEHVQRPFISTKPQSGRYSTETPSNSSLIQAIAADKSNLFKNFPDRPSDYVHAVCSYRTYHPQTAFPSCLSDWKLIDEEKNLEGYHGAAFKNAKHKQVVIAHRGTVTLKDWHTNMESIVRQKITGYQTWALKFAYKIREQAQRDGDRIFITGHSLGAWLAELNAYHFAEEKKEFCPTVTFDSPGAKDMLEKIQSLLQYESIDLKQLDITSYLSAPNPVNTCNRKLGVVYRIYPKIDDRSFLTKDLFYVLDSHSVERMVDIFDPTTGLPKQMKEVERWPLMRREERPISTGFFFNQPRESLEKLVPNILNLRTVASMVNVAADYALGNFDKEQYRGFHKFAKQGNQYEPNTEELSFEDQYFLKNSAQYKTRPYDPFKMSFSQFEKEVRQFVRGYIKFARIAKKHRIDVVRSIEMDSRVHEALSTCEVIDKQQLRLTTGELTAIDLRRYLTRLYDINPNACKDFKYRCQREIYARLEELESRGLQEEAKRMIHDLESEMSKIRQELQKVQQGKKGFSWLKSHSSLNPEEVANIFSGF